MKVSVILIGLLTLIVLASCGTISVLDTNGAQASGSGGQSPMEGWTATAILRLQEMASIELGCEDLKIISPLSPSRGLTVRFIAIGCGRMIAYSFIGGGANTGVWTADYPPQKIPE